ncbi:MAG: hypothetical protein JOZ72_08805 [Alphaproteobacteria bacterium]|nr:hypothetical protein [Alphaproteobacteria bacterium]
MVSHGAPVDDATLTENGADYLDRHLRETVAALGAIEVYGIGIDRDLTRYFPRSTRVSTLRDWATNVLPLIERIATGDA